MARSLHLSFDEPPLLRQAYRVVPWDLVPISYDWSLSRYSKKVVPPFVLLREFAELGQKYSDYLHFYTDGSKTSTCVGCAVCSLAYS